MKNVNCSITPEKLQDFEDKAFDIASAMVFDENYSIDDVIKDLFKYIESSKVQEYVLGNIPEIADSIYTGLVDLGGLSDSRFTRTNIQNWINNPKKTIMQGVINQGAALVDVKENDNYSDTEFLRQAYGEATEVRRLAEIETNSCLFDSFFVNRGNIKKGDRGAVTSTSQLNKNIKLYQEQLVDSIKQGLLVNNQLKGEERAFIEQFELFIKDENDKEIVNSELYKFQNIASRFLSPTKTNSKTLRDLSRNYKKEEEKRKKLDAYNAYVIFTHFDQYIFNIFGKVISIKPSEKGKKSASNNKYSISNEIASLAKSWRTNDNFDIQEEISSIIQIMISTTPVYSLGSDIPQEGKYLNFQHFSNVMAKIKSLGINYKAYSIVFDGKYLGNKNHKAFWASLDEDTKNFIKGKNLAEIINSIRLNPRDNLTLVLNVLANKEFIKSHKELYKEEPGTLNFGFNQEELNHLYSIKKAITENSDNSIRALISPENNNDYYAFFTGVSDSIFQNSFVQVRRDANGHMKAVLLTDHTKARYRFNILSQVNNQRNYATVEKYRESVKDLDIKFVLKQGTDENPANINKVTFKIPKTDITVEINPFAKEIVSFVKGERRTKVDDKELANLVSNLEFRTVLTKLADRFLYLDIANKSNWWSTFLDIYDNQNTIAAKELLQLIGRVVANQHLANTVFRNKSRKYIEQSLEGTDITFNTQVNRINVISKGNDQNKTVLNKLAQTDYILDGLAMSTIVKDSQQSGQNLQSLSRLLGYFPTQFQYQELREGSATQDLTFLNTPGLFLGHYATNEYYDETTQDSKEITKFTVGEMSYSAFMVNFLPGLFSEDKYSLISNNKVSFQASVNSDKGTIGNLLVDLNHEVNVTDDGNIVSIPIYKLNAQQRKELIMRDFGGVAIKTVNNIQKTLDKVWELIKEDTGFNSIPRLNYATNFKKFNEWFQVQDPTIFGESSIKYIKSLVKQYNSQNPNNIIQLVDNVHIIPDKKGNLNSNNIILQQLARYNPDEAFKLGVNLNNYYTYDEFKRISNLEMLESLIRSKTVFNLEFDNSVHEEVKRVLGKNWINSSNTLGIAKIYINGQKFEIYSSKDMYKIEEYIKNNPVLKDFTFKQLQELKNPDGSNVVEIEVNPLIDQFNTLDHWVTQSWMYSTVGNLASHPYGKADLSSVTDNEGNITNYKKMALLQESASYLAQHKRNVSMTAQMHQFQLNLLDGIPSKYNVSVIEDIECFETILFDSNIKVKPHDGATFVNPFINYLENNSLGSSRAGFDKKQFVHYKLPEEGVAGIIKTAGFTVTNDRIRRSPDGWGMLMYKMTNKKWRNQLGEVTRYNILKNWKGENTQFEEIYFAKNGERFAVQNIQYNELDGTYSRDIYLVDNYGRPITNQPLTETELSSREIQGTGIVIESNYDAWQNLFGGQFSLEVNPESKMLQPSESSIRNVVVAMNEVGEVKQGNTKVKSQEQLYQPLKFSDIHYMPTQGAVKQGSANTNSIDDVFNEGINLDYMQIEMLGAGIQLDKEHHADDAELSLPTQIISACASLGYTIDIANDLYKGLADSARIGIKALFKAADRAISENDTTELLEQTLKFVSKEIAKGAREDSFAKLIAQKLVETVEESGGKYSDYGLPISNPTILSQVISTIASYINKNAIKIKIPGLLAVLTPSYGLYKMYGNRTYDTLYNWSERDYVLVDNYQKSLINEEDRIRFNSLSRDKQLLEAMQGQQQSLITTEQFVDEFGIIQNIVTSNNMHKLKLGRTYNIVYANGVTESVFINSPVVYRDFVNAVNRGEISSITENISKGRELGAYNVLFKGVDLSGVSRNFQLWDIDSVYNVQKLMDIAKKSKKNKTNLLLDLQTWSISTGTYIVPGDFKATLKYWQHQVKLDLEKLSKHVLDPLDVLSKKFKALEVLQRKLKEAQNISNEAEEAVNSEIKIAHEELLDYIIKTLPIENQETLRTKYKAVDTDSIAEALINAIINRPSELLQDLNTYIAPTQTVSINGVQYKVDKTSLEEEAYELIMPKTFLKEFGFSEFTNLDEVINDEYWFVKRIISNLGTGTVNDKQYDCVFKRQDGNHFYVLDKSHLRNSELFPPVDEVIYKETEDGKKIRLDAAGNEMYEMFPGMEIYQNQFGDEVIVVDNINDISTLADNLDFDFFDISQNIDDKYLEEMSDKLESRSKRLGKFFEEYINLDDPVEGLTANIIRGNFKKQYENLTPEKVTQLPDNNYIVRAGRRKYASFLKSLEVVAARIPAQSLQSFMPMKVVAYENPNRNSAYVSTLQILLQGSK